MNQNSKKNILRCFSRLKFEFYLTINLLYISQKDDNLCSRKDPDKILLETSWQKSHSSMCQLPVDFATTATNYVALSFSILAKGFFKIQEIAGS